MNLVGIIFETFLTGAKELSLATPTRREKLWAEADTHALTCYDTLTRLVSLRKFGTPHWENLAPEEFAQLAAEEQKIADAISEITRTEPTVP
jgi:hypothetical protein